MADEHKSDQGFEFTGGWLIIANKLCFPYDVSVEEPAMAIVDSDGSKWVRVEEDEDSLLPTGHFN